MTSETERKSGNRVRSVSDTWTFSEYGDRLFSIGGNLYGPRTEMFKLAVSIACIDVLQQDISKTPLYLRRRTSKGSVIVEPKDHPAAALLNKGPNPFMKTSEFLKVATANLVIHSQFYVAGRRTNGGKLMEFAGILPGRVSDPYVNKKARKVFYDIDPQSNWEEIVFGWATGRRNAAEIAHIKRRTLDGLNVISNMSAASRSLDLLGKMTDQQVSSFSNGGMPKVAFAFPDELTDNQFERLQKGLRQSLRKANETGAPIVLEGSEGITPSVQKLAASAVDQEFVKSQLNAAMDLIRYYRVPPHKVYLMESVKYDNMDPAERVYVDDTLCPLFNDIEGGMNHACLTDRERDEYFFQFDKEAAYAMAPVDRQKVIESRYKNGMISKNEMRVAIGHNQLGEDGEHYMVSGNFVLTDQKNEVIMRAGGNSPGDAEKEPEEPKEPDDEGKNVLPFANRS